MTPRKEIALLYVKIVERFYYYYYYYINGELYPENSIMKLWNVMFYCSRTTIFDRSLKYVSLMNEIFKVHN